MRPIPETESDASVNITAIESQSGESRVEVEFSDGREYTIRGPSASWLIQQTTKLASDFGLDRTNAMRLAFFQQFTIPATANAFPWPNQVMGSLRELELGAAGCAAFWNAVMISGLGVEVVTRYMNSINVATVPEGRIKKMFRCETALGSLGQNIRGIGDWTMDWCCSNFSRVEMSSKLAASLACTDVPGEVAPPWKAWSLVIPGVIDLEDTHISRIWCRGSQPYLLFSEARGDDGITGYHIDLESGEVIVIGQYGKARPAVPVESSYWTRVWLTAQRIVKASCAMFETAATVNRSKWVHRSPGKSKKAKVTPIGDLVRVGAPVTIDLRDEVKRFLRGEKQRGHGKGGGPPTVRFLVRGHIRQQPYGPGKNLRKRIRIEPFWKGPEDGVILRRDYKVKTDEG
jgi:hypothetical protein